MASEFSFLVTTDNHMGFKKDDHLRRKDAYMAFDEALNIARDRDVDFILLGGDLFHENKPSASIEHKCIKIIRKHMSSKVNRGTSFKIVDGSFSHFHKVGHANFEDPNLTVPYPIMTIHGNHDDPTGPNAQSVCEKLATCGLLNYFGAVRSMKESIIIEPIVFEKGRVKIALFGLGFIPDFRLKVLLEKGQLRFREPPANTFNILVVHQNRVPYLQNRHIPDSIFPTFFHLIIRGHEHDTQSPEPIPESEVNGLVYQPGSTVATSISIMEARPKRVGLMTVQLVDPNGTRATRYKLNYELVELKCCRRMIMKDISQKDIFKHIKQTTGTGRMSSADFKKLSQKYVVDCIEDLLKEYEASLRSQKTTSSTQSSSSSTFQPEKLARFDLPLIRIRLEYTSKSERFDILDVASNFFPRRVANKDMIMFKKQKLSQQEDGSIENTTFDNEIEEDDDQEEFEYVNLGDEKRDTIDFTIEKYFRDKPAEQRLLALSLTEYTNAVKGTLDDGNVIAKVLSKKKLEMLKQYRAAIGDEEMAEMKFNDPELVRNWFLSAFGNDPKQQGGDFVDDDVIFC